ncbi:GNAT family N-acetyltransferase [Burkholderia sp. Ac-20344]|uniref:GNAT family N-acetyltransferase n=1 Tax=Burkholderia sp. Ac-20344 TaxID=2703890 RepID=UPI00197C2571|nr:GNAT family N-acetyltransferase [Burkholderia sp. Ac-20344]MBN3834679.1 GNAT family N-acetyltransferase [Burkholderia sp. Ac-20344]
MPLDFPPSGRSRNGAMHHCRMSRLRIEFSISLKYPMLTARPLVSESASDRANVLRVFIEAPSYTELVAGRSPSPEDVNDFFFGKPVGTDAAQKSVFGFFVEREMIGCADVIRSYPTDDCIWIGLMLLTEANQGRGHGKAALRLLIEMADEWGYRAAQLAVVSTHPRAYAFWQREGYEEIRRASSPEFTGDLIVMQRSIG